MSSGAEWDVHYQHERPPWETGRPSAELQRVIAEQGIQPCRMVELGCGAGINAIWLAQQGFDVTALDFSPLAIAKGRQRAADAGASVRFMVADVLALPEELGPFPFFFDRGCYHAVRREDASGYVRSLQRLTTPGAVGLVLTGNSRSTHKPDQGPPVVSAEEIHAELGSAFDIVQLREFTFDQLEGDGVPFLAWSCLLRRS